MRFKLVRILNNFPIIIAPLFLICGCKQNERFEYLSFVCTKINTNINTETLYSCILYKDKTGILDVDTKLSFTWEENTFGGFKISLESGDIYTDYDKPSANHYFFYQNETSCFKFTVKDVEYHSKIGTDYKPHFEKMMAKSFSGPGLLSGGETNGKLLFLEDGNLTVYYAPDGMKGIDTMYLTIGKSWESSSGVYRFEMLGETYKSILNDDGKQTFRLNNTSYVEDN